MMLLQNLFHLDIGCYIILITEQSDGFSMDIHIDECFLFHVQVVERCSVLSSIERQNLLSPRVRSSPQGQGHFKSMSDSSDATDNGNSLMSDEQHSMDEDNQDKPRGELVS